MSYISKQLRILYDSHEIKQTDISSETDKGISTIGSYFRGTYPPEWFLKYTLQKFPNLNARWLYLKDEPQWLEKPRTIIDENLDHLLDPREMISEILKLKQEVEELKKSKNT